MSEVDAAPSSTESLPVIASDESALKAAETARAEGFAPAQEVSELVQSAGDPQTLPRLRKASRRAPRALP